MVPNIQVLDDIALMGEEGENVECEAGRSRGEEGGEVNGEGLNSHNSLFALSEAGLSKDWHILQHSIKQGRQLVDNTGELDMPQMVPNFECLITYRWGYFARSQAYYSSSPQ